MLSGEATNTNFIIFGLIKKGERYYQINPR
jgi:hypothetical protein